MVHFVLNGYRGVLNLAIDDEMIPNNPTHRLGSISGKKKLNINLNESHKIEPLTTNDLALLLETFKNDYPTHYPLVLTLARTGLRLGEALGLQWNDIDFQGRFLTLQRNISKGRIETPKNGKTRRVDMSLQLTETLLHLKHDRERQFPEGNIPIWTFINSVGNPLSGDNWRKRVFKEAINKAEMRHIRIHDLRHTYASFLLLAGIPMHYVRDQLGHYSIKVTVDIYGHIIPGTNKGIVDVLDSINVKTP